MYMECSHCERLEKTRQINSIELIASENFTSRAVMEALGSALTNLVSVPGLDSGMSLLLVGLQTRANETHIACRFAPHRILRHMHAA